MKETIKVLAYLVNEVHDLLLYISNKLNLGLTDKQLHFWIMGIIGIISFVFVHLLFTYLSRFRWSVMIYSFIYTWTVMVVLVFAIEIQQAITDRGNMEFEDAVIGLWGFLVFFAAYTILAFVLHKILKRIKTIKRKK